MRACFLLDVDMVVLVVRSMADVQTFGLLPARQCSSDLNKDSLASIPFLPAA